MTRAFLAVLLLAQTALPPHFTEAPAFVPLFTPRGVPAGTYRAFTSPEDLDSVLTSVRRNSSLPLPPGSFEPQSVIASEAFGQSGGYNRWKLALLYGARRTRIARGPRIENGRTIEAWTLISPYPDANLEQLNAGTLLIVMRLTN
jgi:hypothetical protein